MVPLGELAKRFEKLVLDNSPAILTAIGVTGTLTTAYLTGRASFRAAEILRRESIHIPKGTNVGHVRDIPVKEKVALCWKLYIPAAITGTMTVAAIVGANRIGNRRAAALAVAYSVTERAFEEYRSKVVEKLGDKKEAAIRDEIAQTHVDANPIGNRTVIFADQGDTLCYEVFTGRYFRSDIETLRQAQNDLNRTILHDGYASLGDLYSLVGLDGNEMSDEVGWTTDKPLELYFTAVLTPEKKPCIAVGYSVAPVRNYYKFG